MTTSGKAPPVFVWLSPVFFDELDINGILHNSRFAVHVERAQSALFERLGKSWTRLGNRDPDLRYAVRELHVEFLAPLESPGALRVELVARPRPLRGGGGRADHRARCRPGQPARPGGR